MTRAGIVRLDGRRVGRIEETQAGSRFTYDPEWLADASAVAVSHRLPLRREPHEWTGGLHPFFENLLPEGWLLEIASSKLKVARDDAFGMLLATCADCIGAVEVVPDDHDAAGAGP